MYEGDVVHNILLLAPTADAVSGVARNLNLGAAGPKKEVARRIAKAILKPVSPQQSQSKRCEAKICGVRGFPDCHLCQPRAVVISRVPLRFLFPGGSSPRPKVDIQAFDNTDKLRFGSVLVELIGPRTRN